MFSARRSLKSLVLVLNSIVAGCFWSGQALALEPIHALTEFGRQTWLTENGLPQNTVQAITQTSDGYIWLATEAGLARFDGLSFKIFDKQSTPEIRNNDIRTLEGIENTGQAQFNFTDAVDVVFEGRNVVHAYKNKPEKIYGSGTTNPPEDDAAALARFARRFPDLELALRARC